jgi:glycosyltransferase involved in cell wall biosynthesis
MTNPMTTLAFSIAYVMRKPIIVQPHGELGVPLSGFSKLHAKQILKRANCTIAVSEAEEGQCIPFKPKRVEIVPHGVSLEQIDVARRVDIRGSLSLRSEDKIILFLGRFARIKGVDLLIRAFFGLRAQNPRAHLVLAGSPGDMSAEIERLMAEEGAERIWLLPTQGGEDRFGLLREANIVCVPSRYEIFGMTGIEACALGVPLVLSTECHVKEYDTFRAAVRCLPSVEGIRTALDSVLADSLLAEELSTNGRNMVVQCFNVRQTALRFQSIYLGLQRSPVRDLTNPN